MSRILTLPRSGAPRRAFIAAGLALLALALVLPGRASAHERRTVAGYEFVIGFFVEPALEGEKNGLDLRISRDAKPVEGAEKTLQFEVTHVQSNASKTFPVRAVFGTPGRYTADFVPTLPGQYRFKISGNIAGTPINETFESGPGTFSNIEPVKDLMFPVAASQPREIEGALRGAGDDARAALAAAQSARMFGIAGIAIGVVGLASGLAGFAAARRSRA